MVGTTISHYKVLEKIGEGVWERCIGHLDRASSPIF